MTKTLLCISPVIYFLLAFAAANLNAKEVESRSTTLAQLEDLQQIIDKVISSPPIDNIENIRSSSLAWIQDITRRTTMNQFGLIARMEQIKLQNEGSYVGVSGTNNKSTIYRGIEVNKENGRVKIFVNTGEKGHSFIASFNLLNNTATVSHRYNPWDEATPSLTDVKTMEQLGFKPHPFFASTALENELKRLIDSGRLSKERTKVKLFVNNGKINGIEIGPEAGCGGEKIQITKDIRRSFSPRHLK